MTPLALVALALAIAAPPTAPPGAVPESIQARLDAAAPGTTVVLAPGVYPVGTPLRVPAGVSLRGSGVDTTTLLLDRHAWSRFRYGFMVTPGGAGVTVSDLTVDGNRANRDPADATPDGGPNEGGGLKAGDHWLVERVRFTNLNYFKAWILGATDVTVRDSVFDADGGSSGAEDNIGGGRSSGVLIEGDTVRASAGGNAVDLVRSDDVRITGNTVDGHGIYLEGAADSAITGNEVRAASITVRALDRNPADTEVSDNNVVDAPVAAIAVTYTPSAPPGGGNVVSRNVISGSGTAGVAIVGCANGLAATPDVVTGNEVTDPFSRDGRAWGTGCGTVQPSGITATTGTGTLFTGNSVVDTRVPPVTCWAIALAPVNAPAGVHDPVLAGNTGDGLRCGVVQPPA